MLLFTNLSGLDRLAVKLHLACRREKCYLQMLGYYAPNRTSSILQIIQSFVMDAPKKCHKIRYKQQKPDTKDWD